MASNSSSNILQQFDIEDVVNWQDHNYTSKNLSFGQLPSIDLPTNVPLSSEGHTSGAPVNSVMQGSHQSNITSQDSSSVIPPVYSDDTNSLIRDIHSQLFQSRNASNSSLPVTPTFPSENLDIPPITPPATSPPPRPSMDFQITSTNHGISVHSDLTQDNFVDEGMDENDLSRIVEGEIDDLVDEVLDRQMGIGSVTQPVVMPNVQQVSQNMNNVSVMNDVSNTVKQLPMTTSRISQIPRLNVPQGYPSVSSNLQQNYSLMNAQSASQSLQSLAMSCNQRPAHMVQQQSPQGLQNIHARSSTQLPQAVENSVGGIGVSRTVAGPVGSKQNIVFIAPNQGGATKPMHVVQSISAAALQQAINSGNFKFQFVQNPSAVSNNIQSNNSGQGNNPTQVLANNLVGQGKQVMLMTSVKQGQNVTSQKILPNTNSIKSPTIQQPVVSYPNMQAVNQKSVNHNVVHMTKTLSPIDQQSRTVPIGSPVNQMPQVSPTQVMNNTGSPQNIIVGSPQNHVLNNIQSPLASPGIPSSVDISVDSVSHALSPVTQNTINTKVASNGLPVSYETQAVKAQSITLATVQNSTAVTRGPSPIPSPLGSPIAVGSAVSSALPPVTKMGLINNLSNVKNAALIGQVGSPTTITEGLTNTMDESKIVHDIVRVSNAPTVSTVQSFVPQTQMGTRGGSGNVVNITFVNEMTAVDQLASHPPPAQDMYSSSVTTSSSPFVTHTMESQDSSSPVTNISAPVPTPSPPQDDLESDDSDSTPLAFVAKSLKKSEGEKKKKKKGHKRKKDPNEPQKPPSAYALFFLDTQGAVRQQNPSIPFAEVSKIISEMWQNLAPEPKKMYQERWEKSKEVYAKELALYKAKKNAEQEVPSPKQQKIDPDVSITMVTSSANTTTPQAAQTINAKETSKMVSIPKASAATSSKPGSATTAKSGAPMIPSGKPATLIIAMATGGKPASNARVSGGKPMAAIKAAKKLEEKKMKAKKTTINPIAPRICIKEGCDQPAKTTKDRGTQYCSNKCIVEHCSKEFEIWTSMRKAEGLVS